MMKDSPHRCVACDVPVHQCRANFEREYGEEIQNCWEVVFQWAKAAGWELPPAGTFLHTCLEAMRSQHCTERSYADLQASGGLPEAQHVRSIVHLPTLCEELRADQRLGPRGEEAAQTIERLKQEFEDMRERAFAAEFKLVNRAS